MLPINEYITITNRNIANRTDIPYLVMHYVGAVSTAENNCAYFYSTYRGASAHYFVDDDSIWQCVEEKDIAWHCGSDSYWHPYCRNSNSIGIEMCCYYNDDGGLDISDETINNALDLAANVCQRYGISIDRVLRHYDVTGKICPAPFVNDESRWYEFCDRLNEMIGGSPIEPDPDIPEVDEMDDPYMVIASSGLNIRTGAGTEYPRVGGLSYGEIVYVKQMSNGWARIDHNQWVCADYLEAVDNPDDPEPTTEERLMYVTAPSGLNIRIGAGTEYSIIGALPYGTQVTVYAEDGNWGRIGDGQWVCLDYLEDVEPDNPIKIMYVTAPSGLNVRSGASTDYPVLYAIPIGTEVTVYEEDGNWARIGDGEWVCSDYLADETVDGNYPVKYVIANSGLNVRSGAGTNYSILYAIPKGTAVTVYETSNGWSRIGDGEWVSSAYIA